MRWHKPLLSHPKTLDFLAAIAAGYLRLVARTSRWQVECDPEARRILDAGEPFILLFWHQRIAMMSPGWQVLAPKTVHRSPNMIISASKDGAFIAGVVKHFDIRYVKGSTKKGGAEALRLGVKYLRSKDPRDNLVGITPDGPRGPSRRLQMGTVQLARLSGASVIVSGYSCRRHKLARSWDKFFIPLPFTRGITRWGTPIKVARNLDEDGLEAARLQLETALNDLTDTLDKECGLNPIPFEEAK
jgi:lysophospholipid acyltransferase (LPLAT)-like uncharacterized protein